MTTLLGKPPIEPFTWRDAVPRLVQVAARAPQKEAREFAMGQLLLLAGIVDEHIAQLQALADALPEEGKEKAGEPIVCEDCGVRGWGQPAHAYGCPKRHQQGR